MGRSEGVRSASTDALRAAASVAERVADRKAQVRRLFVYNDPESHVSPMAQMLRGGRGGSVRFKLYLSLLWFASNPPYDVTYPARAWAQLLDLPDAEGRGARRISEALMWLDDRNFIESQRRPGLPSRVVLLEESGSGRPYEVPGAAWRRMDGSSMPDAEKERHRYVRLEPTLWTSGWMAVLDGSAVAMYLILLAEAGAGALATQDLWFSPAQATQRYGLSSETRSRGLSQLTKSGLVVLRKSAIGADPFDMRRTRNVYRLKPNRLDDLAVL